MKVVESGVTALVAEWWRLLQAGNAPGVSDEEGERYFEEADAILSRLIELPAATAHDLAAKVLVCAYECRSGEPGPGTFAHTLMSSTVVDAERFADPSLVDLAASALCCDYAWSPARVSESEPH